jgi:glycosyltransferase involved in cell wall biosynthesis
LKNSQVVLVVLNSFKNDSRVLKESITLQKNGYKVTVVALHEEFLQEFETIQNISVHRIKLKSKNWSKNKIIQLVKYLEFIYRVVKLYKASEIFHCNDLNTLPIGVIIKKLFNKDAKIVYDAHEYEINDLPNESHTRIKLKYFLEKFLIKYADKVICVSNAIANEYVRLYNIQKPALVLNTPLYHMTMKKDFFREIFDISKEQVIFLYQGSLSSGRGIEILLKTFQQMNDHKSVIVFMGYGVLEQKIKKISVKYENIYFHPAVSPNYLLDYTSSADFGISLIEDSCLSYRYCLPNKMFEYLMVGLPIIVTDLPEMSKIVKNYQVGVVTKELSPKGLNDAIIKAIKLNKNSVKNNIKKIKQIYNWQEQEKILLAVYHAL